MDVSKDTPHIVVIYIFTSSIKSGKPPFVIHVHDTRLHVHTLIHLRHYHTYSTTITVVGDEKPEQANTMMRSTIYSIVTITVTRLGVRLSLSLIHI